MIRAQNVSKYFGTKRALGPVSFEIEDGEAVGFLGLNGAGKTTALRIFACDLRPSSGSVTVGEIDAVANPHEVRKRIGYLPESPPLYQEMVVQDFVEFAGKLRGMDSAALKKRVPEALELTHISDVRGELIRNLSHGYRQRVGVAQAIVHEPLLLILDEPTRGLDPVQIVEMRNMVQDLKSKHTVLISSHILTEISETCDRLLVLGKGEIIGSGSEKELSSRVASVSNIALVVRSTEDRYRDQPIEKILKDIDGVDKLTESGKEEDGRLFEIRATRDVRADVCRAMVQAGHDVIRLARSQRELEGTFLRLVQGVPGPPSPTAEKGVADNASN